MIETVTSVMLPVNETLRIKKKRFCPEGESAGRISIVTGIHGDELEGQFVCYELSRILQENPRNLKGTVDLYPALNPFGIDSVTRGIPGFDLDMNRIFPGSRDGDMIEYVASEIVSDLKGSDICIDIHASNMYLTEMPQIRINELHREKLVPLAEKLNVDFIWVHGASTVLESTLAYSMNSRGVPTLVVEMGVGMRITRDYGEQLVDGILNLMCEMGLWSGKRPEVRTPLLSDGPDDVEYLNARRGGIFIKEMNHGTRVRRGDRLGQVVDPLQGKVLFPVLAPVDGLIFTIREYPLVQEGTLIARILKDA